MNIGSQGSKNRNELSVVLIHAQVVSDGLDSLHGNITFFAGLVAWIMHQVIEMANKEDIQASVDLTVLALEQIHQYDWSWK